MGIIVTGANGFIGHHLISKLAESRVEVSAIVRKIPVQKIQGVNYFLCDLSKPGWTEQIPKGCGTVVHLAQSIKYREFPDGSRDMFEVNVQATFELLEWSIKAGIKHFIHASTGNVYKPSDKDLDEDSPCEPNSMYGSTKLAAETMVRQYQRFFQTTVLRIFGVYGPGQENMLIPNIIASIREKKKLFLSNNIGLRITPLHVADLVKILGMVLYCDRKSRHGCFNICGDEIITLYELIQMIARYTGLSPEVEITDGNVISLVGLNRKFKEVYGFQPEINFSHGLREILLNSED